MDASRHSAAGGSGGDVAALSASLGLTGVGDASAAARSAGPRRRRPAAGDCSDGDSSAGSLDGSLHGLLDGSLHGLRRARDGSLHGLLDGSLRGLRSGGGGGDDAARHSPLSLPRHALATGESLDASDHFRGDAMARALPETSLRRAREFDDSSHRSALCGNQIFNPTSMCAYATVSTRGFLPCFENSTRAIDPSKNQPNRLRCDRAREF